MTVLYHLKQDNVLKDSWKLSWSVFLCESETETSFPVPFVAYNLVLDGRKVQDLSYFSANLP